MNDIFAFKNTFPTTNFKQENIENGWEVWNAEREFGVDQGINFSSPTCVNSQLCITTFIDFETL